jgi:hypothetical protein
MTGTNPAAPHHIPWFIASPDGSDPVFVVTAFIVLGATLLIGVLFFTLHSLPERLGHKKLQFEIVAVLGLISLFTHMHIFWVIALILALIDLPDFTTPLGRIANALEARPSTGRPVRVEASSKEKSLAAAEHEA